ncbi:hypothetical protein HNR46_002682 [Haloferula luteola]|uniref:Uncharacterized protein n=1 Tax=Haloferula luteola TaxID=595692 RepID=A0A840V298_9BACT|nr:hypothetical protein [Haloferula luteola]MBB5352437.1 hypothetical protein [Haloferula luteola]
MTQFGAIFVDSLRLLRGRSLFWITLGISLFAGLMYLSIGFTATGYSVGFGLVAVDHPAIRAGSPMAGMFYFAIFSVFLVNVWLSWVAVVLALITCAPIFPEFMAEGAAGSVLSKPISRWRLFAYKYVCGLLFALIQTAAFCVLVFLAMRWRVGSWNPTIFWAVPLITLMFSYLWAVMVAVGIKTRSVMAALLSVMVVWMSCWMAKVVDDFAWSASESGEIPTISGGERLSTSEQATWKRYQALAELPYRSLPKTTDTVNLLQRFVRLEGDREFSMSEVTTATLNGVPAKDTEVDASMTRGSPQWIIGSSLVFELMVVAYAGWLFCRRDF